MTSKMNKVSDIGHRPTRTALTAATRRLPVPWIIIAALAMLLAAAATWTTAQAAGTSPGAPTGLQIAFDLEAEPQAAMTLQWNAPASDGGSPITGHQYRWRARSGNFWIDWTDIPDSGAAEANAGSYTLTGLTHPYPPQVYTFEVRAVNGNGASTPSNQDTKTYDVPSTINEIRTTPGDGSITLEWDTPASNGRRITHYHYAVIGVREGESPHTAVLPQTLPGSTGDTTTATLTGLTNGMPHSVALAAVNAVGTGSPKWTEAVVPATGAGAPTDLAAEPGDGSVTLSWTAPASDGGSPVTGYSYQQKEGTGDYGAWTEAAATAVETTEHTVTGLMNESIHTFRVRANTGAGSGAASAEASATPLSVPSGPAGLEASAGNAQVTLTWNAPTSDGGSAVTSYQHRHRPAGGAYTEWTTVTEGGANANTITLKQLINGTRHTFEVRATSDAGKGAPASVDATPQADPPSAPSGLSALHFDRSVQLVWTAPESNGGSPVIRYEYRQKAGEAAFEEWTAVPNSGAGEDNQASHRAGDLANGTQYTFELRGGQQRPPRPRLQPGLGHSEGDQGTEGTEGPPRLLRRRPGRGPVGRTGRRRRKTGPQVRVLLERRRSLRIHLDHRTRPTRRRGEPRRQRIPGRQHPKQHLHPGQGPGGQHPGSGTREGHGRRLHSRRTGASGQPHGRGHILHTGQGDLVRAHRPGRHQGNLLHPREIPGRNQLERQRPAHRHHLRHRRNRRRGRGPLPDENPVQDGHAAQYRRHRLQPGQQPLEPARNGQHGRRGANPGQDHRQRRRQLCPRGHAIQHGIHRLPEGPPGSREHGDRRLPHPGRNRDRRRGLHRPQRDPHPDID